jgi:hypothetical protein
MIRNYKIRNCKKCKGFFYPLPSPEGDWEIEVIEEINTLVLDEYIDIDE